ncbi:uncharacterized protein LOC124444429 [Xenia sp. Carnegie-2017]|uniref:uncharacterized protein LOC124444429 n=1 Tax=Xenia sp. Carnegie-2017 TaxID=2897299 RepID=UPI001F033D77|nr:uncharacterized protein LOC124444429 [Xenia sp. Carnegie-2017]
MATMTSVAVKQTQNLFRRRPIVEKLTKWYSSLSRKLFLSSVIAQLLIIVILNACAGITFLLASNMSLVCDVTSHHENIDRIFDISSVLPKSTMLPRTKSIQLFKKLSECPENGTLWTMLDLDDKVDINSGISQLRKLPHFAERLFLVGDTFHDFQADKKYARLFLKWKRFMLESLEIDSMVNETIESFKTYRKKAVKNGNAIRNVHIEIFPILLKRLRQDFKRFQESRAQISKSIKEIKDTYFDITSNTSKKVGLQASNGLAVQTIESLKSFINEGVFKIRSHVGKCLPMKKAYYNITCLLCHDIFRSWNRYFLLFFACAFLTTISIIVSMVTVI